MRRNEMIAAMMDAANKLGVVMDYADASSILGRIENEGMKPPKRERYTENGTLDTFDYIWESEDEEK